MALDVFAYIPARGGSKRIPRKNIKPLDGTPILQRVIKNLSNIGMLGVGVSTDDAETVGLAQESGAITLDKRSAQLSNDEIGFIDLAREDIPRFSNHFGTPHVMLTLATAGLVDSKLYQRAIEFYFAQKPALLMAVTTYPITPLWALVKEGKKWRPLHPYATKLPSHKLPETRVDAGLFYIFNLDRVSHLGNLLDAKPLEVFDVPEYVAVDVDTPEDWEVLRHRFNDLPASR